MGLSRDRGVDLFANAGGVGKLLGRDAGAPGDGGEADVLASGIVVRAEVTWSRLAGAVASSGFTQRMSAILRGLRAASVEGAAMSGSGADPVMSCSGMR